MIGFGSFGKKRKLDDIVELSDNRLKMINTLEEGFYNKILDYESNNEEIKRFCCSVRCVKEERTEPFFRPTMDPSLKNGWVVYKKENKPATMKKTDWWLEAVTAMPAVEGRHWKIGTEYQYYAFLVYLINSLVESGWTIDKAIEAVVVRSDELGVYKYGIDSRYHGEYTGSREICGFFDLANTSKIVTCKYIADEYWYVGGNFKCFGYESPLANIISGSDTKGNWEKYSYLLENSVAWLVL